jgi:hypothetical protein
MTSLPDKFGKQTCRKFHIGVTGCDKWHQGFATCGTKVRKKFVYCRHAKIG